MLAGKGKPPVGAVFHFPDFGLDFTPKHGSMVTFQPSQVWHGTCVPDEEGQGCQRIGLAVSLQRNALNVAIQEHEGAKRRIASKQQQQIAIVDERRAQAANKDRKPSKKRMHASK